MAGHSQDCRKAHVNVSGNVFFRDHCPSVETNPCKKNNNSSRRYLKATGPLGRDLQVLVRDLMPVNFQRRQLQSLKLDMPWSPRCPQFLATRVETCGPESGLLPTGSQWPPAALLHLLHQMCLLVFQALYCGHPSSIYLTSQKLSLGLLRKCSTTCPRSVARRLCVSDPSRVGSKAAWP